METKLLLSSIVFFMFLSIQAQIINVPGDYPTIQQGIDAAVDGDTVLVQPETYTENINFFGKEITVASLFLTTQDTAYVSQTIIDGNQNGTSVVIFENGESQDAVLTGFTVTNGNSATSGGGIMCVYSNPNLSYLMITENAAEYNGGGIICGAFASPTMDHVLITDNTAGGDGAGIYCYNNCNPSLENVIISGNNGSNHGGGICCLENCSPIFDNVNIYNNNANQGGGIFCAFNSNLSLMDVNIENNSAIKGGGLFMAENSPMLSNTAITNNSANLGGGIYCENNAILNLSNSIVRENLSTNKGAGIYSINTRLNIDECEFTGNEINEGLGGAIYYTCTGVVEQLPEVNISNSTISDNVGLGSGSAAGVLIQKPDAFPPFNVQIENCIFEGNISNSNTALTITGSGLGFSVVNCSFLSNEARMHNAGAAFTSGCAGEITNCLFASNIGNTDGGTSNTGGLTLWNGVEANLFNCTFVENSAFLGTALTMYASEAIMLNCIVWDNTNDQITLLAGDVGSQLTVAYSDIQNGENGIIVGESSELIWEGGNITEDPELLDYGEFPFSLGIGSPCIDIGTPDTTGLNLPEYDLAGEVRVFNDRVDMGAYEWNTMVGYEEFKVPSLMIKVLCFPSPFTNSTTLEYQLNHPETVRIEFYNQRGMLVDVIEQNQSAGKQQVVWDAKNLPAGVYFCVLRTERGIQTIKMIKLQNY